MKKLENAANLILTPKLICDKIYRLFFYFALQNNVIAKYVHHVIYHKLLIYSVNVF